MPTKRETDTENKRRAGGGQKEIYTTALRNRFITLDEARGITDKDKTARMALWRLTKNGNLVRVREGLYAAIPLERSSSDYEVDRYVLFDKAMGSTGALAFHSALELHGAAYSRFTTVFYLTTKKMRPFEFQDITYRTVWTSEIFGRVTIWIDDIPVQVTDKERTFLDCIRRPDLCGGVEEYLKSVEAFTLMSPVKLLDYLQRFGEQSLYQRAGLILSELKDKTRIPDNLLDIIRSKVSSNVYYLLPNRKTGGKLVREWNVMVPRNLEELMRFV